MADGSFSKWTKIILIIFVVIIFAISAIVVVQAYNSNNTVATVSVNFGTDSKPKANPVPPNTYTFTILNTNIANSFAIGNVVNFTYDQNTNQTPGTFTATITDIAPNGTYTISDLINITGDVFSTQQSGNYIGQYIAQNDNFNTVGISSTGLVVSWVFNILLIAMGIYACYIILNNWSKVTLNAQNIADIIQDELNKRCRTIESAGVDYNADGVKDKTNIDIKNTANEFIFDSYKDKSTRYTFENRLDAITEDSKLTDYLGKLRTDVPTDPFVAPEGLTLKKSGATADAIGAGDNLSTINKFTIEKNETPATVNDTFLNKIAAVNAATTIANIATAIQNKFGVDATVTGAVTAAAAAAGSADAAVNAALANAAVTNALNAVTDTAKNNSLRVNIAALASASRATVTAANITSAAKDGVKEAVKKLKIDKKDLTLGGIGSCKLGYTGEVSLNAGLSDYFKIDYDKKEGEKFKKYFDTALPLVYNNKLNDLY